MNLRSQISRREALRSAKTRRLEPVASDPGQFRGYWAEIAKFKKIVDRAGIRLD
jgi:hypothetical protein